MPHPFFDIRNGFNFALINRYFFKDLMFGGDHANTIK